MAAALASTALVGCDIGDGGAGSGKPAAGLPDLPSPEQPDQPPTSDPVALPAECPALPACDGSVAVDPNGAALMVTDPAVLSGFRLERVLSQIIQFQGVEAKPEELMQRFFDTMNSAGDSRFADAMHCDGPGNLALVNGNGDSFTCPRAEGQLATSTGFFSEGDPDYFYPVAIVDRFDLTPVDGSRCGQYRIIYAKSSGLTDPDDRVFMIFEAALSNPMPGCLESCRPVADFWKGLENQPAKVVAERLETFFFNGLPGFKPAVHPLHYGLGAFAQAYGGSEAGQVRVSMHMEDPWDMREMQLDINPATGALGFAPTTVKNNPAAAMFDPAAGLPMGDFFRQQLLWGDLPGLAAGDLTGVQMASFSSQINGVESVLAGAKKNDYVNAAIGSGDMTFVDALQSQIDAMGYNLACPANDPFDAEAALRRANALSCAGCHAPKDFLGNDRGIGCGLIWPDSIGQSHVTEKGEISPALKDVFLPHRAEVLATFLQACDLEAINGGLQPSKSGGDFNKELLPNGATLGGSQTH